jgi:AAT family amino acid transporter
MPLIPGQGAGLAAGMGLVLLFSGIYIGQKFYHKRTSGALGVAGQQLQFETAEELAPDQSKIEQKKSNHEQE